MPCFGVISVLETLFLGSFVIDYYSFKMFEEIVSDAVQMLILLFWITLALIIIWGALWARGVSKTR
jgi:hypothetical protein